MMLIKMFPPLPAEQCRRALGCEQVTGAAARTEYPGAHASDKAGRVASPPFCQSAPGQLFPESAPLVDASDLPARCVSRGPFLGVA
jgi:hypothetical protein